MMNRTKVPPSWGGYLLVAVVLVLSGAFAGQIVHNTILGARWQAALEDCSAATVDLFPDVETVAQQVEAGQFELRCTAPAEHRRALVSVTGAAAVGLFGLLYMRLRPAIAGRRLERRRSLDRSDVRWQEAADEAAAALGVSAPVVLWAPPSATRPFTLRWDGADRVLLPPGVRSIDDDQVRAVIAHEVAHVAARDTRLVWLCRAMWWALPLVLAVPVILIAVEAITDGWFLRMFKQPLWWQYLLRAAGLLTVAYFVTRAVDRTREHRADLDACALGQGAGLKQLLEGQSGRRASWLRAALALHPSPERRLEVIADPRILWRVTADEALAACVLSALAVSAVYGLLNPGLVGTPLAGQVLAFSGLAGGMLLSAVLGWRISTSRNTSPGYRLKVLTSTAVGCVIGLLGAFSNSTRTERGTDFGWHALITVPVMVAGALGLIFVLANWHEEGIDGLRIGEFAVSTVLLGGAFWLGINVGFLSRFGGVWTGVLYTLKQALWAPAAACVLVGVTAWMLSARPRGGLPRRHLMLVAGVTIAVVATTVAMRFSGGPVRPDAPENDWWSAAAAGVVATIVLLAVAKGHGARYALAAAPLAVMATSLVAWARYPADFRGSEYAISHFFTVPLTMTALAFLVSGVLIAVVVPADASDLSVGVLPVATAVTAGILGSVGAALTLESVTSVLMFPTVS